MRCFVVAVGVCMWVADALDCSARGNAQSIASGHDLTGKVVLLTGSDTGIGYETALALAGVKATVIIANHNAEKGQEAAANITRLTGNTKVESLQLDLSSFNSTRKVAATVLAKHESLDILINDAGVATPQKGLTADGFEYVMQVNYISHFLLEQLLLPALRASGAGKVIHVSSGAGFRPGTTDLDNMSAIAKSPTSTSNYGLTKFMMIYNARELSVREAALGSKVRGYSIRPGLVDTPLVREHMPEWMQKELCSKPICGAGFRGQDCDTPCPMKPSAGANSPTYVAVTDLPEDQAGDLYWQCQPETPPAWSDAAANQAKLYDMSLGWTSASSSPTFVV